MSLINNPIPDVDKGFQQRVENILDSWLSNQLNLQQAMKEFENLRQESLTEGNQINEGFVYNTLGVVSGYRANYDEALNNFHKAWELFNKTGAKRWLASCELNMGEAYRLKANFIKARQYFHNAYENAQLLGLSATKILALSNEGQMWQNLKSAEKAKETMMTALLECLAWLPDREHEVNARIDNLCEIHYVLASIWLEEKHAKNAWENAKQVLFYANQLDRPVRLAHANRVMGDVISFIGKALEDNYSSEADTYYLKALDLFKQVKAEGEVGKTLFAYAESLAKRGKKQIANTKYQQALLIFTRLGMTDDAAKTALAQMSLG